MSLADPQNITIATVAETFNRISTEGQRSIYQVDDEDYSFTVSHQTSGKGSNSRTRRMVRLDARTVAANPLTSVNEFKTAGVYLVIDEPEYGFSDTVLDGLVQALKSWATTTNVLKVLTNQH